MRETRFAIEELAREDRFDALCQCMGSTHAPMYMTSPHARDFDGSFRVLQLGPVSVWPTALQTMAFHRTRRLIRQSDPELYHLSFLTRGSLGFTCEGRETTFGAYEWRPNDSSKPYTVQLGEGQVSGIGLEVPKELIPLPRDRVDLIIGRRLTAREGMGSLLANFVTELAEHPEGYRPADGPRLATVAADLVTALFAHALESEETLPPEPRRRALAWRVEEFIQQHLADPGLTPTAIAAAHHISVGYLHRLFHDRGGPGIAAGIRAKRLERIRHDLADPAQQAVPIHTVAARWGLTNPAAFSRLFRTTYGMTPGEYREQALHVRRSAEQEPTPQSPPYAPHLPGYPAPGPAAAPPSAN